MLPTRIAGAGLLPARLPRPVGRAYALRALSGEGEVPVSAVDTNEIRRQCLIALTQTVIRDLATIGVVAASAVLEPAGTAIVLGLAAVAIIIIGRARLFSLWTASAIAAIIFIGFEAVYLDQVSYAAPLAALAACFVIYLTDILLAIKQVRKLWRVAATQRPPASARAESSGGTAPGTDHFRPRTDEFRERDEPVSMAGPENNGRGRRLVSRSRRFYYDDDGIIGAGMALRDMPLTVPVNKPLDPEKPVAKFSSSVLLRHVGEHLLSHGVADDLGYAHLPLAAGHADLDRGFHFTHGLPWLSVGPVVVCPVPAAKKSLFFRVRMVDLKYRDAPSAAEILSAADRPQYSNAERSYVRACTSCWDGQVVASIFLNVTLQGHTVTMVMKPYVLAPVVPELSIAEELAKADPLSLGFRAFAITIRQFKTAASRIHHLGFIAHEPDDSDEPMPDLRSTRERYAQASIDEMHQVDDSNRIFQIWVPTIVDVIKDYLRECNIDLKEYERQADNIYMQIFGDGVINTGNNNNINNAQGNGNRQGTQDRR